MVLLGYLLRVIQENWEIGQYEEKQKRASVSYRGKTRGNAEVAAADAADAAATATAFVDVRYMDKGQLAPAPCEVSASPTKARVFPVPLLALGLYKRATFDRFCFYFPAVFRRAFFV